MKTVLCELPTPSFNFAGFKFPKFLWDIPTTTLRKQLISRNNRHTGAYYHAPTPILGGCHPGTSFYLEPRWATTFRWEWCDETKAGSKIRHTGWFCDDTCLTTIRGIVVRLPHGRGFLAGWSMGENMASVIEGIIYPEEYSAAYAANDLAKNTADAERMYAAKGDAEYAMEEAEFKKQSQFAAVISLGT